MSIDMLASRAVLADPLDQVEMVAGILGHEMERVDAAELHLSLRGLWRDTGLWFTWRPDLATLQIGAPIDLRVPAGRVEEGCRLIALVNERLWVGHFDMWSDDKGLLYRNAIVLPESGALERSQAQRLIEAAGEAVDRFFPAFNYLVWGGKRPEEALEASMFETAGSA